MSQMKEMVKEAMFKSFEQSQSLNALQQLKNLGVELYRLSNNQWQRMNEYKLPLDRFVRLYDENFNLKGIGAY